MYPTFIRTYLISVFLNIYILLFFSIILLLIFRIMNIFFLDECQYINFDTTCFEQSLLEFWPLDFDFNTYTTSAEIIEYLNSHKTSISSFYKTPILLEDYLGGATYENEVVVTAQATFMRWYGRINVTSISDEDISSAEDGEIVDKESLEWELALKTLLMEDKKDLPDGLESFVNTARSYGDVAGDTIMNDALMMPIGFGIVFVYVTIMLGKFSCTEQRALLALGGLLCIGLTIGFTYGFCSAINLFYGPMHNIIPFLLLGIGIDDMFVIIQCYDNLGSEKSQDNVENIGKTMRHAGVAITVTSLTDFIVFVLGATTVLPALRSFCLWCGVGIIAVYFFQATLFAAFLSLDCRRLASNRNGLCPCYTHEGSSRKEGEEQKHSLSQICFRYFSKFILSIPGIVLVLLAGCGLLAGGIYGTTELKQKFDPVWFLPPSTDIYKWFSANEEYFPSTGEVVTLYLTEIDWKNELDQVGVLEDKLRDATDIIVNVDSWYKPLKASMESAPCNKYSGDFNAQLTCFLYTTGFQYQSNFQYVNRSTLTCGEPAPPILLGTISFTHARFSGRDETIPALNQVKDIISSVNFNTGDVFPMNREYSNWETDEVITKELFRNLGLAIACVFVTTLILLANLLGSIYVMMCVVLTLVDLCGYMHFWGLTIDVVSSVNIIIAIGKA